MKAYFKVHPSTYTSNDAKSVTMLNKMRQGQGCHFVETWLDILADTKVQTADKTFDKVMEAFASMFYLYNWTEMARDELNTLKQVVTAFNNTSPNFRISLLNLRLEIYLKFKDYLQKAWTSRLPPWSIPWRMSLTPLKDGLTKPLTSIGKKHASSLSKKNMTYQSLPSPPLLTPLEIQMPWMWTLSAWKSSLQLTTLIASGKDFASNVTKRDIMQNNADLLEPRKNPRGATAFNKLELPKPHPLPPLPLPPLLQSPQSTLTSRISPLLASENTRRHPSNPEDLLWAHKGGCRSCHHFFLQWGFLIQEVILMSSSHDLSHVPIRLPIRLATRTQIVKPLPSLTVMPLELHWYRPSIQGQLPLETSPQTHLCIQCWWNSQHQRNH